MLVAEDNKVNQVVVKQMLEKLGCRVDAVDDGLRRLEAVQLAPYHLVFMDVQMPEMDGLAATGAIRALHNPGPPRRVDRRADRQRLRRGRRRCIAAGMNDFVAKPIGRPTSRPARRAAGAAARPRRRGGVVQSNSSRCASVGGIAKPLIGIMSCGQAENARSSPFRRARLRSCRGC